MAEGSTRQPAVSATRAPDSTMPRSTAEAMKGQPSERAMTVSTAASGSGPAIDSARRPHVVRFKVAQPQVEW